MNPHSAYQAGRAVGWTRIELLLALYDAALDRLDKARQAFDDGNASAATPHLLRVQRIVCELSAALDLQHGEVPRNLQRLYAFVLDSLTRRDADGVQSASSVLKELREAWREIRSEAARLERAGSIPPVESTTGTGIKV